MDHLGNLRLEPLYCEGFDLRMLNSGASGQWVRWAIPWTRISVHFLELEEALLTLRLAAPFTHKVSLGHFCQVRNPHSQAGYALVRFWKRFAGASTINAVSHS
jgi:hypothetical protein